MLVLDISQDGRRSAGALETETALAINIRKATSMEETAPERKHVRVCIVDRCRSHLFQLTQTSRGRRGRCHQLMVDLKATLVQSHHKSSPYH